MQAHPLIFTVTLLVFEDHDEALAADERISRLKRDLGLPSHFECIRLSNCTVIPSPEFGG